MTYTSPAANCSCKIPGRQICGLQTTGPVFSDITKTVASVPMFRVSRHVTRNVISDSLAAFSSSVLPSGRKPVASLSIPMVWFFRVLPVWLFVDATYLFFKQIIVIYASMNALFSKMLSTSFSVTKESTYASTAPLITCYLVTPVILKPILVPQWIKLMLCIILNKPFFLREIHAFLTKLCRAPVRRLSHILVAHAWPPFKSLWLIRYVCSVPAQVAVPLAAKNPRGSHLPLAARFKSSPKTFLPTSLDRRFRSVSAFHSSLHQTGYWWPEEFVCGLCYSLFSSHGEKNCSSSRNRHVMDSNLYFFSFLTRLYAHHLIKNGTHRQKKTLRLSPFETLFFN